MKQLLKLSNDTASESEIESDLNVNESEISDSEGDT